jgi:acyl dehydratase
MAMIVESIEALRALTGQEVAVSDWIVVDQARIDAFAEVTGDRQWIHVDAERARRESPYGRTIAHGFLTLSLLSALSRAVEIGGEFSRRINYGLNRVRFPAPVRAGARVRGRFAVQAVEDVPEGVQVTWAAAVEVEGESKPAVAAEWVIRMYR